EIGLELLVPDEAERDDHPGDALRRPAGQVGPLRDRAPLREDGRLAAGLPVLALHLLPGRLTGGDPAEARPRCRAEAPEAEGHGDGEAEPGGAPAGHATPASRARVRRLRAMSTCTASTNRPATVRAPRPSASAAS